MEGPSKRDPEEYCGRTSQNKFVVFPRAGANRGDFVRVRITDASSATLHGEIEP